MTAHSLVPLTLVDNESDALALAGAEAEVYLVGGARVVFGSAATVMIASTGDDLAASGVRNNRTFELVGPALAVFADRVDALPRLARDPDAVPILLFVQVAEGLLFLGAGKLGFWQRISGGEFTEGAVRFDEPLTDAVLDRVRPPIPVAELPGTGWLEHISTDPSKALAMFAAGWPPAPTDPPVPSSQHDSALRMRIPGALAHFHRLAEERPHLLGRQNYLHAANQLSFDAAGLLTIGSENQGGHVWLVDPEEPDPTVWLSYDPNGFPDREYFAEREPLSRFLLQFALDEAPWHAPYNALATQPPAPLVDDLTQALRRVPLRSYWWSGSPTSFYVAPGLVLGVSGETGDETYGSVLIGTTHRSLLRPFAQSGIYWSHIDS